jgi:hypothetical protein
VAHVSQPVLSERQFEIVLARLDRIGAQIEQVAQRLEVLEALVPLTREVAELASAMTVIAHAAMGREGPRVRWRGGP